MTADADQPIDGASRLGTDTIERRLRHLARVFPLDELDGRGEDQTDVARYYVDTRHAYRFLHSSSAPSLNSVSKTF
jgi:hypothetical protein